MHPTEGKCSLHLDALVGTYSPQAAEICLLAWLGAFMKASVRAGQRRNKTVGSVVVGFVYAILVFIMLNGTFDVSVVNLITHMFTKYLLFFSKWRDMLFTSSGYLDIYENATY